MPTKPKMGRPIGGKHSEVIRDYWRTTQQLCRASKKFKQGTKIGMTERRKTK